jgi:hypothetical protein
MTNYCRLMSPFVAAICIAAVTWTATPAAAEEGSAGIGTAAKSSPVLQTSPSVIKRHAARRTHRTHVAVSRYNRRVSLVRTSPECSGEWCGRQFVLMIGIGF